MNLNRLCLTVALFALATFGSLAQAAENLAVWQFGSGTIATKPAVVGGEIAADAAIASGDGVVRVTLAKAPKSHFMLSPHSVMRLEETAGGHLVVHLDQGVLQANIGDKGPYSDVHVLGAALDVRVTGTLFVVERVKADTDYVALVEGRVQVNLRKDVAVALNEEGKSIDLSARQGLGGSLSGFAPVDTLTGRPQLPVVASRSGIVRESGTTTAGGWDQDMAMSLTNGELVSDLSNTILDEVRSEITQQVSEQVVIDVTNQVTETIVQQIIGGFSQPLAAPPGPPN